MTQEKQTTEQAKSRAMTRAGGTIAPLVPKDLAETWQMAQYLALSGIVPDAFKRERIDGKWVVRSPDEVTATVFGAIQMGATVGLPAMAAIANIMIVNGKFALYGDAQLAVVRDSGRLEAFSETYEGDTPGSKVPLNDWPDDFAAVCKATRDGVEYVQKFSVNDAKRAKLWGKTGYQGKDTPWTTNPLRMLRYRARAFLLRDVFPDALLGLTHTVEELVDMGDLVETTPGVYEAEVPARPDPAKYVENEEDPKGGEESQGSEQEAEATDLWPLFDSLGETIGEATVADWCAAYIAAIAEAATAGEDSLSQFADNNSEIMAQIGQDPDFDNEGVGGALRLAWEAVETPSTREETPEPDAEGTATEESPPSVASDPPVDPDSPRPEPVPEAEPVEPDPEPAPEPEPAPQEETARAEDLVIEVTAGADGPDWGVWFRQYQRRIRETTTMSELLALREANAETLAESPAVWRTQLETTLIKQGKVAGNG